MMGRPRGEQSRLFHASNLDELIRDRHRLRVINPIVTRVRAELREKLQSSCCRRATEGRREKIYFNAGVALTVT